MDQRTHAWIAIRAIALLEDGGESKDLVKLIKPHAAKAAIGAWIPDLGDAKRAGSQIGKHVLKMKPYKGKVLKERFIAEKEDLLERLGKSRLMSSYIENDTSLKSHWWNKPYKGDIKTPGQHLANRAMAMSVMMRDLLIMGDQKVDKLLPGAVRFAKNIDIKARTKAEQVALYFFMLSHFISDACMPCHTDARKISAYNNGKGLHHELESRWSNIVKTKFDKKKLLPASLSIKPDKILKDAKEVDTRFDLKFKPKSIPNLVAGDVWLELINICRGSFAVASIIASPKPSKYPYSDKVRIVHLDKLFPENSSEKLKDLDRMVMHDAVLNNAIIWRHIWQQAIPAKMKKKKKKTA